METEQATGLRRHPAQKLGVGRNTQSAGMSPRTQEGFQWADVAKGPLLAVLLDWQLW